MVIDRPHLYYDMKLVTFGIDKERNLIIQFAVFIEPYTQQPLILYQIETVPVPIIDQNTQAHSYTHLQIDKPYIALNSETYITIRQELRTCKRIHYEFYCEKPFVVKHKSKYSCESVIYFNLNSETIKENCKFNFYYDKRDMNKEPLLFHIMLKQRNYMVHSGLRHTGGCMNNITETINDNIANIPDGLYSQTRMQLQAWVLQVPTARGNCGHWSINQDNEKHPHIQERPDHPGHILQSLEYKTPSLVKKWRLI